MEEKNLLFKYNIPSDNLADILEQLGTLNDRHEQLRALVEALEV